jgi:serine/threonine-protein kinase PknG
VTERDVRFRLESCYRTLAWLAAIQEQRNDLVDRANAIRPRTVR